MIEGSNRPSEPGKPLAWAVHLFTASGVVLALLALAAVEAGEWNAALLWLFAALLVDGLDGTFARAARVKEALPRIDGDVLDLVIDYLTYVFIPALIIWRAELLPPGFGLALAAAISVSSLHVFARRDMKTDDGYFRGFPGLWNVVALYLIVARPDEGVAAAVICVLVVLTFAPVHVAHPFRVRDYGPLLPGIALLWGAATATLLVPGLDRSVARILLWVSLGAAAVLVGMGALRTIRGPKPAEPPPA